MVGEVTEHKNSQIALAAADRADVKIKLFEAQAVGPPVLAAGGGALEIVADGVTGILVKPRTVDELADAMRAGQTGRA